MWGKGRRSHVSRPVLGDRCRSHRGETCGSGLRRDGSVSCRRRLSPAPPLQLLLSPCRLCLPHGRRSRTVYGPRLLPRYSVLRTTDFSRNLPAQDGYTEVSVLHTAGLSSEVNVLYNRSCCSPHEYFPENRMGSVEIMSDVSACTENTSRTGLWVPSSPTNLTVFGSYAAPVCGAKYILYFYFVGAARR